MFRWLSNRKLNAAWRVIAGNPAQARPVLEDIAKRAESDVNAAREKKQEPKAASVSTAARAWLGVGLCDIRLQRWAEAADALSKAETFEPMSSDDIVETCRTWLEAKPDPLPEAAAKAYGRYLALPEDAQSLGFTQQLRADLDARLLLPEPPDEQSVAQIIALGEALLSAGAKLDWVAFRLGIAWYHAGGADEAARLLAQAAESEGATSDNYLWLGRALWRKHDYAAARAAFLRAHELAPGYETALEAGRACVQTAQEPFGADIEGQASSESPADLGISLLKQVVDERPSEPEAWLTLAEAYSRLGRTQDAEEALEKGCALDPNNRLAVSLRGRMKLAAGDIAAAREALEQLEQVDPQSDDTARLAGDIAFADGDYQGALRNYRRCSSAEEDIDFRQRLIRCYLECGIPQEVLKLTGEGDAVDPQLRLLRARALAQTGHWDQALKVFESGGQESEDEEVRYYHACALAANDRYDEARPILEELVQTDTWRDKARRQLGHIALRKYDHQAAETYYLGEKNPEVQHGDLGCLLLVRGQPTGAVKHFSQAMEGGGQTARQTRRHRLGNAFAECLSGNTQPAAEFESDPDLRPWSFEFRGHVAWSARQIVDAVEAYEEATKHRDRVPTFLLARLAEGYLHLSRFREALPHLVELARRDPSNEAVARNLGYCRFQLARKLFKQGSWDAAREEYGRVRRAISRIDDELATAVGQLESEAAWRQVSDVLRKERWSELPRTLKTIGEYCERMPDDSRWWLAHGLALAFSDDHAAAADAFAKAGQLKPDDVSAHLGRGLSLQSSEQSDAARQEFARVLELTTGDGSPLINVASRFSLAMSHAADKQWKQAAEALEPLLGHPLIAQSQRIGDSDIAQAMAAYLGLAGETDRAKEIASRYLKGESAGNILIALVQADSGDYEGAARRLASVYKTNPSPGVQTVLLQCLVSLAAKQSLEGEFEEAEKNCKRALNIHKQCDDARRLLDAIRFASKLGSLDVAQLDEAITQCEPLAKDSSSPHLLRTLGILYHRQAVQKERARAKTEKEWGRCLQFWRNRILDSDKFWEEFLADYNAGKKGRERLKPDTVEKLQGGLRGKMAELHRAFTEVAFEDDDIGAAKLHLGLIWEWKSDYKVDDEFTRTLTGAITADNAKQLRSVANQIPDESVRNQMLELISQAEAIQKINKLVEEYSTTVAELNSALSGGVTPWNRDRIISLLRKARRVITKLHNLQPDDPKILAEYLSILEMCQSAGI